MLYFAYGSNLDFVQMRERCPSAQFVTTATLPAHRLAFTRKSIGRNCGVADAVVDEKEVVWGVVFAIAETDLGRLDNSEGFRPSRPLSANSYNREERHVFRNDDKDDPLLAWIYLANRQSDPPLPNAAYKKLILEGARFWHLPEGYIKKVEDIEVEPA